MLRGLALEYLTGVLPEEVRTRLWEVLDAGASRPATPMSSETALEELLKSQDGLLDELTRHVTPSGGDAPAQSGRPRTATPPSDRQ